jgi:hypothetical protein
VEECVREGSVPSQPTAITITSWLIEAFAQHQAGQWAEAEKIYRKIFSRRSPIISIACICSVSWPMSAANLRELSIK